LVLSHALQPGQARRAVRGVRDQQRGPGRARDERPRAGVLMTRAFFLTFAIALFAVLCPVRGSAEVETRTSPTHLELRGSSSLMPLTQAMAEKYMQDHPGTTIVVGHSRRGIKAAIVGTADIAMATSFL